MKDITSYNDNGELDGYWEMYYYTGKIHFNGHYINGKQVGY